MAQAHSVMHITIRACFLCFFYNPYINSKNFSFIILGDAKKILGCSSRMCNEAVRGDMGIDTLRSRRDKAKLK